MAVPLVVVTSVLFFRRLTKVYEAYQEQDAVLSTTLQENLTGVRVVKAFARQAYERTKFEGDNWEKFVRGRRLTRMHSLFWPVSDIICGSQLLGGLTAAALMAIDGTISVGTYLAYAGLVVWLIWPMRNLGRLIVQMSSGLVSYGRVTKVLSEEREALDEGAVHPDGSVRGEIVFRDVCFDYGADAPVLKDITFDCRPGQAVALLGPTGSGKTSLVNLLPRFYDYTGGSLTLDGVELKRVPAPLPAAADRHRRAGAVPLLPHHPREHHLRRRARGGRRRGRGGRPGGGHPRHGHRLPAGLRHAGRRKGGHPLRRAEAARGHRPHPAEGPAHPDPGRFHLVGRHRDRGRDPRRACRT